MSEVIVEIRDLKKNYDDLQVLKGIDLVVRKGEKVVVLGPSLKSPIAKPTSIKCVNT